MRIREIFAPLTWAITLAAVVCVTPSLASAGSTDDKKPVPSSKPDLTTKVYTNDNFGGWRAAPRSPAGHIQPGQTSGTVYVPGSSSPNLPSASLATPASAASI